ncbi:hypothetical protein [Streptomyces yatensis]|nr:hypothetical protein [Streptomyces yatensis]
MIAPIGAATFAEAVRRNWAPRPATPAARRSACDGHDRDAITSHLTAVTHSGNTREIPGDMQLNAKGEFEKIAEEGIGVAQPRAEFPRQNG